MISTASLPDIIFILLFFFMVATTMRETTMFVTAQPPQAFEIQKLEKSSPIIYTYVGKPRDQKTYGTDSRVQVNDRFINTNDLGTAVIELKENMGEDDKKKMTVALKIDKDTRMGIVTDIKEQLREPDVQAYKINYTAQKKVK